MNEKYLRRIEEDQEREMRQLEDKIHKEVRLRFSSKKKKFFFQIGKEKI